MSEQEGLPPLVRAVCKRFGIAPEEVTDYKIMQGQVKITTVELSMTVDTAGLEQETNE